MAGGPGYAAVLRRTYDAPAEDVWDAITTPERLERWFLPVSGNLEHGGKFQLEGHAGGDIVECDRPRKLHLTWMAEGHPANEIVLVLTADGDSRTTLELEHSGPGEGDEVIGHVLAVGVGWDPALIALGQQVAGETPDKQWWFESPEALEFTKMSVRSWAEVLKDRKVADADAVDKTAEETLGFYTPE
ncbi:SRPBCC domain-containing protein [Saccharothrix sp. BKS2]|uniref:SRPBCC domain-containing protein n=1 Tax=Saccharothrix lopnurensis TaxID=1670621 RepID=A0ABW1P3A4_9PSEU